MNFKLDENFGNRTQHLFKAMGHDVQTVSSQTLSGCSDQRLYEVCCVEKRCLITMDLDFADVIRFSPSPSSGIAIFRVPRNPGIDLLEQLANQFLKAITTLPIEKKLWIVELGRIRIHQSETESML